MPEIDYIILKYLQGETSEEENLQLFQWIRQSPENKKRLFAEKDIWNTYAFGADQKKYNTVSELERLKKRLSSKTPQRTIYLKQILRLAAMLLISFGLGWVSQFISFDKNLSAENAMQEIFVPKGQVNQVFLADGTRIWINSETRLITPSIFASKERVVKLSGEAFFEVAKDKNRPFKVEVNGQLIEVVGTAFNVRAYNNSNEIETTLESGQIRLHTGQETMLLKQGEQSVFDKKNNRLFVVKVDPETYSSWKDGRYEFHNKDLNEVFRIIERWYDVEITADSNDFKGMHFSGVIKRNKDARHFLDLLNHSVPIKYTINADKIQIAPK